ncbi:MAG: cation transporter [Clostridia bacterium]|nr:cation transporter [Clostridia bacterium]
MSRNKKIIRTSLIGIAVNIVLVIFKMIVGLLANSIAIILDAVNNLSDALSSVITIIGTKLAGRKPDKKHPYGHGRIEYLTSVLIAVIMLFAGISSLKESIVNIFHPEPVYYTAASLVVVAGAVVAKFFCGKYVKKKGEELNSGSLIASGTDAFFDAVISIATFVAAIINMAFGVGLEGILGAIISLFIIKSGLEILADTLSSIIGSRADGDLVKDIKERVMQFDGVRGVYDISLHNYGPTQIIGSIHIELPDDMSARAIHILTRRIAEEIYIKYGVVLTVGIYATNNSEDEFAEMKKTLAKIEAQRPEILQTHGFYGDREHKRVMFDIIVDFKENAEQVRSEIVAEMQMKYPDYKFDVILDSDLSD